MTENRPDGFHSDGLAHDQRRARRPNTHNKLYRSSDKVMGGIAGGVASYIDANPRNVRLVFVLTLILTSGFFAIPYLVLWWLLPVEK
jgi:phage shock protein C